MRVLPVTFAVLLVLSSVAAAAGTTAPTPTVADAFWSPPTVGERTERAAVAGGVITNETAENATLHVLGIPPSAVQRSSLDTRTVDLGPSLAFRSNATAMRLQTIQRLDRIESARSEERRQQLLVRELSVIEQRVISMRAKQRAVIAAYGSGDIGARALLVELAILDIRASALDQRRARIGEIARSMSGFSVDQRTANLERELDTFTGPVRKHAVAVLGGSANRTRFFVRSGPNSVVLGTIDDGAYVREVYRGPLQRRDGSTITTRDALNITAELYPNVYALRLRENGTDVVGAGGNFLVRIQHERGSLSAFVDSGSETVFKEYQRRPLDTLETTKAGTAVKDGLVLTAYRTYAGGPVLFRLNDSETGEPVDARITVGPAGGRSTVVGRTGPDGRLWTLAPGQTYQVTAIDQVSVVLLSVDPATPPLIHDPPSRPTNSTAAGR
jgi:hypothetical protein